MVIKTASHPYPVDRCARAPSLPVTPTLPLWQVALAVKNLPAKQETQKTQVQSLGWEDPMEEEMATHSSILAWRSSQTEEPRGLQSMRLQTVGHD